MEDETYDVYLAIYDLSHGMARSLSAQFLGPNHSIDIIPHSGVVVYNREYFFGGGIQMESPTQFRASRGIQPVQILHIGKTRVSQRQFEHWCATVAASDYSPTSYDLLHKNCNNFADFALRDGLRLNSGVPDWVLDVPQTFLSSPLGAMLRPMLQNMQMSAAPVNRRNLPPVLSTEVPKNPAYGRRSRSLLHQTSHNFSEAYLLTGHHSQTNPLTTKVYQSESDSNRNPATAIETLHA